MRDALKNAVQSAILFECQLPHQETGIDKSCLSSQNDICFKHSSPQDVAKVIYNGIVEFAVNEFEIDYDNLEREQRKAILSRIRYNPEADDSAKLKYGFYGEVLLDLILRVFLRTSVVAARGYFYSPIENSEPKGFDAFHLMNRNGNIDLWFGEAISLFLLPNGFCLLWIHIKASISILLLSMKFIVMTAKRNMIKTSLILTRNGSTSK